MRFGSGVLTIQQAARPGYNVRPILYTQDKGMVSSAILILYARSQAMLVILRTASHLSSAFSQPRDLLQHISASQLLALMNPLRGQRAFFWRRPTMCTILLQRFSGIQSAKGGARLTMQRPTRY